MDFALSDEQAIVAATAQSFFEAKATSERTRCAMAGDGIDHELWADFCTELGFGGLLIGEAYGGASLGLVEFALVAQAAGAQVAALPLLGLAAAARSIAVGGSDAQKTRWLPKLADGDVIAASGRAFVPTGGGEIASGESLGVSYTRGDARGDAQGDARGDFVQGELTGTFCFVPHGAQADLFMLSSPQGAWLVEARSSGVQVEAHTTLDQTRPLATLRLECASASRLPYWRAGVQAGNQISWLCLAAEALGGAQACFDRTLSYVKERVQFGRTIGSFQAVKHRLADRMVDIEQSRSAVYWAACALDESIGSDEGDGENSVAGSDEASIAIHAAKSFCADIYCRVSADMIQLHGGIGFTWEHDAHLYFKRARSIQTMLHNGDWHREQIARHLLGEGA